MNKDLIIEFIATVIFILFVIFLIWLFIFNDYLGIFLKSIKIIAPLVLFIAVFLIKTLIRLHKKRKKLDNSGAETMLRINYSDKIKADIILLIVPTLVYVIPFLFGEINTKINAIQSIVAFIIIYFWQKNLFSKEE